MFKIKLVGDVDKMMSEIESAVYKEAAKAIIDNVAKVVPETAQNST